MENSKFSRITIDGNLCNGKPTIRGLRITVQTILEFIFSGSTSEEILKAFPILELEDIEQSKEFALSLVNNKFTFKEVAA